MGWRARLGFLIPPGNPTVEPEMIAMAPPGVSVHFSRMVAHGATGTLDGQEERNRTQIEHLSESAKLLAMVKPNVVVLAHTATSYTLGRRAEVDDEFVGHVGFEHRPDRHLGRSRQQLGCGCHQDSTQVSFTPPPAEEFTSH